MTALALAMQDEGWQVSGSDTDESFITDSILASRNLGVRPLSQKPPVDTDLIIYSGAYSPPNSDIRTLSLAEALAEFVASRQVIAIAGVGGKTTTSAMLAVLMRSASRDVGYYIGTGSVIGLDTPGASGSDPYYVVEADEYAISSSDTRPKFALLAPKILITTNIIHDHPDIYPDESATLATFTELIRKLTPGSTWICNSSDSFTAQILNLPAQAGLQGQPARRGGALEDVKVIEYGLDHPLFSKLNLSVFGDHNRLDALAAVLASIEAGLTEEDALKAITHYYGAERRQQKIGEVRERLLYDDYGHHPDEIKATIQAFKQEFPQRRLVLVFESHTYSRTKALFSEFAKALALADLVYVMPIFESAREKGVEHTVTHTGLSDLVNKLGTESRPLNWDSAAATIAKASREGDLILTMGAGFVYKLHPDISAILQS